MSESRLRFTLALVGKGWLEASLSDGASQAMITTSYLSNAITELLLICTSLVEGAQEGQCIWKEEPGEYRWLFTGHEEQIKIRVLWFNGSITHRPDEEGECKISIECSLLKFATKLKAQLDQLLKIWGIEGYKKEWGYAFPQVELEKLRLLLKEKRDQASYL